MKNVFVKLLKKNTLILILSALLAISGFLIIGAAYGYFKLPKLVEEINNAAIGAIITAFITVMLLKQQTASVEIKERNSKIFEKKLEFVDKFLDDLKSFFADREINSEEEMVLIFQLSNLRLHFKENVCKEVVNQITELKNLMKSPQEDKSTGIITCLERISLVFRRDLYEIMEDEEESTGINEADSIQSKTDILFQRDEGLQKSGRQYFILNTDRKNDVKAEDQMLAKKIGTIYSSWKHKLIRIKPNDIVFLYSSGRGLIAMGAASGAIEDLPGELCSISIANGFRQFKKPIATNEIKSAINGNIVFLQTIFSINPNAGEKLFNFCDKKEFIN